MSLLWRSLRGLVVHQGILYALSAVGVALGVAAVVSIQMINQNALAAFSASVDAVSQNADLLVRAGRDVLPEKALAEVLSDRDVDSAQPIHKVEVAHFDSDGTKRYLDVLGLNLAVPGSLPLSGAPDSLGEILAVRGWSALPPELADELGLEVGDRFRVVAGTRAVELRMSATVDFRRIAPLASSRLLVMDIAQSQDLFQERGVIDEINVFLVKGASARVAQERLRSKLGDVASIMTPGERRQQAEGLLRAFRLNLTALSLISLLVGLFLVYTTIQATLVRRRRELGVLRSLGATRGQVLRLLLTEAAVVGLIGTLIGLPIGWFAATLNVETVSGTLRDIYLLDEIERLVVPTWIYVLAACLGLGGAVLGALLPSIDAAKREPRELLGRSSLADTSSRWSPRLAVLGGALLATVSMWYVLVGQTQGYAGFVLAAALLLSIPLLTPFVMRAISARAPADSLGAAYAIRTLQGGRAQSSALTVAALGIVFSMLVAITFMVGSFRATLEVWIDRVVLADVFISTATSDHGSRLAGFGPAVVDQIRGVDGVEMLDAIRRREGRANERPVRIVAVDLSLPGSIDRFPMIESDGGDLREALLGGGAVLITEPFARKSETWSSGEVRLETPNGIHTAPVAGVFYDYSTENGVVYMHKTLFETLFGETRPIGLALYLRQGVDPEQTVAALRESLATPGLNIRSNRTLRTRVFEIFEQTFAITRLLQGMSLLIAAFGITLTLFVIAKEREAELALYRALGATRRQVFQFFVGKGAALGGVGVVIGAAGGALLASILIFIVNRQLFGWTIQVFIPWAALLEQVTTIVVVALAAAAIPAFRASTTPATELTRDAL